ncbi:MAG: hypothetical protein IAG13_07605 [Deltaproteobacteria bacterium]|nr:hypothetical protein [Nannocystaceae bacterium]
MQLQRLLLIASVLALPVSRSAHASSPRPDAGMPWPVCSAVDEWFCIESAAIDGVDMLVEPGQLLDGGLLQANASLLDENSVNWSVTWNSVAGELPEIAAGAELQLVLRLGDLQPMFTQAIADEFHLEAVGDAANGYGVSIEGSLATLQWHFADGFSCTTYECGDDFTQATIARRVFSGNTQNMALWDPAERAQFGGAYTVSNAQVSSPVMIYGAFPEPHWYLDLGNPHLTVDGSPAGGSFTAWVPPSYFEGLGTTAADAVAAGFEITRTVAGVEAVVTGSATLENGGAYIRVDWLGYSTPRITVTGNDTVPDEGTSTTSDDPGGGTSGDPGGTSGEPGSTSREATSTSDDPGSMSGETGSTSNEPGTTSIEPGTTSAEPGTTSIEPGTTSIEPGTTSIEPGTTDDDGSSSSGGVAQTGAPEPTSGGQGDADDDGPGGDEGETTAESEGVAGCGCTSGTRGLDLAPLLVVLGVTRRRRGRIVRSA